MPPEFLEYLVILCFERRHPIQSTVASLKSRIWPPRNFRLATLLLRLFKGSTLFKACTLKHFLHSIARVRILTVLNKKNKFHCHWLLLHFMGYCFHFLYLFPRNSFYVLDRVSFCYITIYILVFKTFHWTYWPDNLRVCRCPSFGKKIYIKKMK